MLQTNKKLLKKGGKYLLKRSWKIDKRQNRKPY